jgi:hypothetical protein
MELSANRRYLWVTFRFARHVGIIDMTSHKLIDTIEVGRSPWFVFREPCARIRAQSGLNPLSFYLQHLAIQEALDDPRIDHATRQRHLGAADAFIRRCRAAVLPSMPCRQEEPEDEWP